MTGYADPNNPGAGGRSVTTQYALDNGRVLTATAGELTTTYLYGLGPIGEMTDKWTYSLPDGANTPRQLVNAAGEVTLTSSYTPWGDTLSVNGTGSFTQGYLGGVMDAVTGLLYVGNGQYYDPETGRFLNRNAKPEQTNPYVPWGGEPTGALFAPLALLVLLYGRKKTRSRWDNLVIAAVLCLAVGMCLAGCGPNPTPTVVTAGNATATITPIETPKPTQTPPVAVTISTPTATATLIFAPTVTPTPCPTSGRLPYTYLDKTKFNPEKGDVTGVTAEQVYELYKKMWEAPLTEWWWLEFGKDNEFSIWDFISTMTYYEASGQTRFASTLAEAGVRFYYAGSTVPGNYPRNPKSENIINWWAEFSESTARIIKGGAIGSADVGTRSNMAIVGDKFKESPPEWRSWKGDAPFNWGNLYAIKPVEKRKVYKENAHALFINCTLAKIEKTGIKLSAQAGAF
jgi:RHS repeat-associated protein